MSWRPWATQTCGSTARARKHGSRPGYPWRAEADGPDNEVDEEYRRIDAYYDYSAPSALHEGEGQRCSEASLHLDAGPGPAPGWF